MAHPARLPRADNRLPLLLNEAARLFGERGFHGTTIRDVVRGVDMLPGSLYYHFAAKEDLLAAVYAEGV
ncbi:MAG TPA: helix-turn-helix domain-containing protein [Casimicrobiaceae bacterium]